MDLQKYINPENYKPAFEGLKKSDNWNLMHEYFYEAEEKPLEWILGRNDYDMSGWYGKELVDIVHEEFAHFGVKKHSWTLKVILHLFSEIWDNFGIDQAERLLLHLKNYIKYNDLHNNKYELEFCFRTGRTPIRSYLYVFEDSIDFADEITEQLIYASTSKLYKPHIKVSMNKPFLGSDNIEHILYPINGQGRRLIDVLNAGLKDPHTLDITIPMTGNTGDIIITKQMSDRELKSVGKIGQEAYFGKLKDVAFDHGEYTCGKYEVRNRIEIEQLKDNLKLLGNKPGHSGTT